MKLSLKLFLVITLLLPAFTFAQLDASLTELTVTLIPDAPRPNSKISFRLTDYSIDLSTSNVRWFMDGKEMARGVGLTEFSTVTAGLGELSTVLVRVTTSDGLSLEKTTRIRPAEVDVVWEADSAVPLFYKGKPLPSTKNDVKFYAIPQFLQGGKRIDPAALRYSWSLDFENQPRASGIGKSTFGTKIVDLIGNTELNLVVSTQDGSMRATTHVQVSPASPLVLVYNLDPLMGTNLSKPLPGNLRLEDEEATFYAADFFFPKSHKKSPGLSYIWSINGKSAVTSEESPNTLTVRSESGASGQSRITIFVRDPFDSFITAVANFMVEFGSTGSFGSFQ